MTLASETQAAKENVLIAAGELQLTLLPRFGGKIASIRVRGSELLQAPLIPCAPRTRTMSFDAGDASGWDEMLPSVAACTVETAAGMVAISDHGDLWRVEWQPVEVSAASATFRGECFSLPLTLERTVSLSETEQGWRLRADYMLTNIGDVPLPWSWAAHPLFAVEAGDRIVLPKSVHTLRLEGSGGGRLGKNGDPVAWPLAKLDDGGQTDLSRVQPPESGVGDKLFAGPLTAEENWCSLDRPKVGVRIRVGFDAEATPYLGLWICSGGWPERPGAKQFCVALEPATAPVDSLAQAGPWSRTISPGQSVLWPMTVDFEPI